MGRLQDFREYLQKQWNIRTTKERWNLIYMIGKLSSDSIGVTVYGDMKNYWYSYFPAFVGIFQTSMIVYTISFYCSKGDYKRAMECTCPAGVLVAVRIKLIIMISV